MKLSIVTTLYRSSNYINEFYERISKEAQKITTEYEIVFVDDGSPDDSLTKALAIYKNDGRVKIVELSRNFGHHKAIMAGLENARGDFVFLIDCDLEEKPELLEDFWQEIHQQENADVIYGVQDCRKGAWFERWSGSIFWKVFNALSHTKISENPLTIRIMKKEYVIAIAGFKEKELFLAGIFELVGFKQKKITVKKSSKNTSNYNLTTKIKLLNNAIVSFSSFPLLLSFYVGLFVSTIALFYGFFLILNKIFYSEVSSGWTSLMVSIWFLSGVILLSLGIIGIYLSKIYTEVKNRPTVIKKIIGE